MTPDIHKLRCAFQFGRLQAKTFTIQTEEWTADDQSAIGDYLSLPGYQKLKKCIHRRMTARTEDLVNGQDTRKQIEELRDLLLELESYADPS